MFRSIFVSKDGVLWAKKSIGYGFKNLLPRKKPTTVTRQLAKSQDFRQNNLCNFHLRAFYVRMYPVVLDVGPHEKKISAGMPSMGPSTGRTLGD
jgi:hypothetical protein